MNKVLKYLGIFFFTIFFNANSNEEGSLNDKIIICKLKNSEDIFRFHLFQDKTAIMEKILNINNQKEEYRLFYEIKGRKLIISNPHVLPIRQETHINLETFEMKTGIFTNRYPLVNKGFCKFN